MKAGKTVVRCGNLTSVISDLPALGVDVPECPTCEHDGTRLCRRCAKSHLPQLAQPHWVRLIQSSDAAKGAEAPDVARATLTLKARQRKRTLQMHRRRGMWGLAKAILNVERLRGQDFERGSR